jgi:hypothetical protein
LLGEARSSWEDGEYEFAFLQAVIAAEIATMRAIRDVCKLRGVSQAKLNDLRREMTYSLGLNIHLQLCFEGDAGPSKDLIQAMNQARSLRNDLMHEGIFKLDRLAVNKLLGETREYVKALRSTGAEDSSEASPV